MQPKKKSYLDEIVDRLQGPGKASEPIDGEAGSPVSNKTNAVRLSWTLLGFVGLCWTLLDFGGLPWTLLDFPGSILTC